MSQPPFPPGPPGPPNQGQWSNPPPGYPSQYPQPLHGFPPPPGMPPQPGTPPPEKKGFRFQMWMLGLIIIPIGIGLSARDLLKRNSIELGGECSDSQHCKSGTCLTGDVGQCTKTCSQADPCPSGFACEPVRVTLHNQAGFHNLGTQTYCIKGGGGDSASASSSSDPEPPAASAEAPPQPAASAEPSPAATESAEAPPPAPTPKPKPKAKPKPKPKK